MSATDRLAQIRARAEAATEGPWRVMGEGSEGSRIAPDTGDKRADSRWLGIMDGRVQPEDGRNAAFIAHAREDIPALLAAVEAVIEAHLPADGHVWCICGLLYPCDTVAAITEALA